MALTKVISFTFSATGITLNDDTGDYNVTSNPTGWGAPNIAFSDYAHMALIRKKNVNNVADELLTLDTYNELTAESFTADRSVDGWYEGVTFDILIYTAGSYLSGDVVYDNGTVYQANTNTSNAPGHADWDEVASLEDVEDSAATTIIVTTVSRVTAYNADVYWSTQIAENSQAGHCGVCEDDRLKKRLDTIYRYIQNVLVADQLEYNTDGEWNVLRLIQLGAV